MAAQIEQGISAGKPETGTHFGPGRKRGLFGMPLRYLLFAAFLAIAIIPVGLLAVWVERSAFQKEIEEVRERHLLIARNLSHAMTRYSHDTRAVFDKAVEDMMRGAQDPSLQNLLGSVGFEHTCILDPNGSILATTAPPTMLYPFSGLDFIDSMRDLAAREPGRTFITGVMGNAAGEPRIFLVRQLADGNLAIAAQNTSYLVSLQQAIAFGEKGHSAIVDAGGRVIAHPREDWRTEMKDISAIAPVKRMMAGETGVATFYSPAMNADMIAGFTTVPDTGWGVMVPQPIAELKAHANNVQSVSIMIGAAGLAVAVILAWILSRYLARPIERIASIARTVEAGNHSARVGELSPGVPDEIRTLAASMNQMLGELARSSEKLRDKADEAEAANRAKSRFLANMSHEFRTPLNAIIGYSDIMRDEMLGPVGGDGKYLEYSEAVRDAGVHILGMVNEILLLTRAETGNLYMHSTEVDIRDCVRFAISMVEKAARDGGITLDSNVDPAVPVLETDDGKLRQILLNLASNAVKFTDQGGRVSLNVTTSPGWGAVIEVRDNGIGIAAKDMQNVMKPFGQVQDNYSRNHGGTGLGLPLTQELVNLMGGEFVLSSEPGRGTVATVRLPLKAPPSAAPDDADATAHEGTALPL